MLASPAAAAVVERGWPGFEIIVWQPQSAAQYRALKDIGVSGGMLQANRETPAKRDAARVGALREAGLRWYVENIATDFYSAYHRWTPGHAENYRFDAVKQRYAANPDDPEALQRDPSLSDPGWQKRIAERLGATVAANRRDRPLFYDLADEAGIADLAAYWDFDFSPVSLAAFRRAMRHDYPSLAALNRQWGTRFAEWRDVVPETTAAAMRRSDGNFSAWADFKAWMDGAFADALRLGRDAVHAADPTAVAAIAGAQVPGWGGYDYARLATAVDAMEIYDFGDSLDIVHSLSPGLILLTTTHGGGAAETHRIWHDLLHGTRGLILWDDEGALADPAGPRWSAAVATFRDLRGTVGTAIAGSRADTDAVAILYSPASMRTQWMLDWQPKGDAWSRLDAAAQYDDNALRTATTGFARGIGHLGLQPRFVTDAGIAAGDLQRRGIRALVLPHAVALSAEAAQAIRRFAAAGGIIVADAAPGVFDEHSRKLPQPALADLFAAGKATVLPANDPVKLQAVLAAAGVVAAYRIEGADGTPVGDVEAHRFRSRERTILALQRDLVDGAPAASAEAVVVALPRPQTVSDLRSGKSFGRTSRVTLSLDPVEPTLLALADDPEATR